ncbi:leucine-richprotein 1 (LRRP1) [Angomonas deanei]|uniref:Uncharacterized protein n=1 Tax=Angomonas deanei TaxID=59799 RepID=A0A7G2CRT3_9TRYP|nr:leucine-richprotein 1 (LRRP1) [Angomonas deanei]CAD2221867.1 hypothetical protein, conserved [Angomonas deanei]|eukprot:EPY18428.1 leucine-richprotein 1 (LRRP1) [Angomonas deanei]
MDFSSLFQVLQYFQDTKFDEHLPKPCGPPLALAATAPTVRALTERHFPGGTPLVMTNQQKYSIERRKREEEYRLLNNWEDDKDGGGDFRRDWHYHVGLTLRLRETKKEKNENENNYPRNEIHMDPNENLDDIQFLTPSVWWLAQTSAAGSPLPVFFTINADRSDGVKWYAPLLQAIKVLSNTLQQQNIPHRFEISLSSTNIVSIEGVVQAIPHHLYALNINHCENITDLACLEPLTALRELYVSHCSGVSSFHPINALHHCLRKLEIIGNVSNFFDVGVLDRVLPQLTEINIAGCTRLKHVDALRLGKDRLQRVRLFNTEIHSLVPLTYLKSTLVEVYVSSCPRVISFEPLSLCENLEQVYLSRSAVNTVSFLARLAKLRVLHLAGCTQLTTLSPLRNTTSIQQLNTAECPLTDWTALEGPMGAALRVLDISSCAGIDDENFSLIGQCVHLVRLTMTRLRITDVAPLAALRTLRELNLTGCRRVTDFTALQSCHFLQTLKMKDTNFSDWGLFRYLPYLSHQLVLDNCSQLPPGPTPVAGLQHVKELYMNGSTAVTDASLPIFGQMPSLERLSIAGCNEVTSLDGLLAIPEDNQNNYYPPCQSLRYLYAFKCTQLQSIHLLHRCPSLQVVSFMFCAALDSLAGLAGAPVLEGIVASHSTVTCLTGLAQCPRLQWIEVGSTLIESLLPLQGAPRLVRVGAQRCEKLSPEGMEKECEMLKQTCPLLQTVTTAS